MIYDYLLSDLMKPPPHPIWIEHLTKKIKFPHFGVCKPPPPLTEGMVEVCSREAAAFKKISVKQHVFTTYYIPLAYQTDALTGCVIEPF